MSIQCILTQNSLPIRAHYHAQLNSKSNGLYINKKVKLFSQGLSYRSIPPIGPGHEPPHTGRYRLHGPVSGDTRSVPIRTIENRPVMVGNDRILTDTNQELRLPYFK